jgi:hypothetical protein
MTTVDETDPRLAALLDAIRSRRAEDPLVGARVGAAEIRERLVDGLRTANGVHAESLLAVIGALAGQAAQASLRARAVAEGRSPSAPFQTVRTGDGRSFVIGEELARALAEDRLSPWSLVAGEAQHAGCRDLPDLGELFAHGIRSLGSERFGVPEVPDRHQPLPGALSCLPELWPRLFPLARLFCPDPAQWPVLFGLAAQQVLAMAAEVIDPCIALRIVMDTAIANAKVVLPDN